jgi:hypothetical protein
VNPGPNSCATGGCNGGLLCDPNTGTARMDISLRLSVWLTVIRNLQGVPPTSVAEWTLGANGNLDYYDVSLVDGTNLPMTITSNKGCPTASCPVDLNPNCKQNTAFNKLSPVRCFTSTPIGPSVLAFKDSSNVTVGCKSSCYANLSGNSGAHASVSFTICLRPSRTPSQLSELLFGVIQHPADVPRKWRELLFLLQ